METSVRKKRRVCIVDVRGRLMLGEGEGVLRRKLAELLDQGERRFVFNLDGLSVLDSSGVGEIVLCYKTANERAAVLKIALAPGGPVRNVFTLSGLERALEVFDEESEAVSSFS